MIGLTRSNADGAARAATPSPTRSANAVIIAAYTIVDGLGVRASGNALQYVALLFMLDGLPYFAIVMWQRRATLGAAADFMRRRWPVALLGSCASLGAYAIALWAMTQGTGRLGRGPARDLGPVRRP